MKKTIFIQNIIILLLFLIACSVFFNRKIDNNAITQQNIERTNRDLQLAQMTNRNAERALAKYFRYDYSLRTLSEHSRKTTGSAFNNFEDYLERQMKDLYPVTPTIFDIPRNDIIDYPKVPSIKSASYEKLKNNYQTLKNELNSQTLENLKSLTIYDSLQSEVDSLLYRQNKILGDFQNKFEGLDTNIMASLDSNQQILFLKNIQTEMRITRYELKLNWILFSEAIKQAKKIEYQIILSPDEMARVGQPFRADVFL